MIGYRAKIDRAAESLKTLEREVAAFVSMHRDSFSIKREFRRGGQEYAFVGCGELAVPPRFSVIAGEIVHHLRSSLDHLIVTLVMKNGGVPTRKHQFPICSDKRFFEESLRKGLIRGIGRKAEAIVRSVQPFTSEAPDDTVLYVVQQYDNVDKHQLLIVVSTVMAIGDKIEVNPKREGIAITGLSPPYRRKIGVDEPIFTIDFTEPVGELDFEAQADFVADIAFDKCGRVELAPVVQTLEGLLRGVSHTIGLFDDCLV